MLVRKVLDVVSLGQELIVHVATHRIEQEVDARPPRHLDGGDESVSSAIRMIWPTIRLWARPAASRPVLMSTPVCFKPTISKSFGHMDRRLAFGHLKGRQGLGLFPSDRGSYTLMYVNLHPWAPRGFSRS